MATPGAPTPASTTPPTNLLDVIKTLFRWRKWVIGACLVAGIGSAAIALLLPEYFQASTTFFATSPDQTTPELLFGDGGLVPQLYGNENDMDRILTIGESNDLIDFLLDSFRLAEHYDINTDSPRGQHNLRKTFRGYFELTKTKRDAIQLSIEDKDPELAAILARAARERINHLGQVLVKNSQEKSIATFEADIEAKGVKLKVLADTLEGLRKRYGIFNTEAQSESLTGLTSLTETRMNSAKTKLDAFRNRGNRFRDSVALYEIKVEGLEEEFAQLNNKLDRFSEGLAQVLMYTRQYQQANSSLSIDKEKLKQYQAVYESDIPAIMLVEDATVPLIKSRPFRALIVLGSILITLFFVVVGILLYETYRDLDWRAIYHGS